MLDAAAALPPPFPLVCVVTHLTLSTHLPPTLNPPQSPHPAPGGSSARQGIHNAQQMLASGAKAVGDTLTGAAYSAADLVRSAGINLPRFLDGPTSINRGQLPASLKQELVCALLGVIAQHPSAGLALQLPAGEPVELPPVAEGEAKQRKQPGEAQPQPPPQQEPSQGNGVAHDQPAADGAVLPDLGIPGIAPPALQLLQLPPASTSPPPAPLHPNAAAHGELQERAVLWLDAAVAALQATGLCLQWEPLLPPPLPGQPPAPKLPAMESVNLTTVPVDMWLQLLQGTCAASRAVLRAHGHAGLKTIYRANGGRMLARLTAFDANGALAHMLESASIMLQTMIQRVGGGGLRGRGRACGLSTRSTLVPPIHPSYPPVPPPPLPPAPPGPDRLAHPGAGGAAARPVGGGALPGAPRDARGHLVGPAGVRGGHAAAGVAAGGGRARAAAGCQRAGGRAVQKGRAAPAGERLHMQGGVGSRVAEFVVKSTSCLLPAPTAHPCMPPSAPPTGCGQGQGCPGPV
jgi:hypothetical protein